MEIKRRRPLRWHQKLARKILEVFFELCFLFRATLRFKRRPELKTPCVVAVYHEEMVAAVECFKHRGYASIASRNHNGYAVAQVIRKAGYHMVYGSTTKGGREAFFELNQALADGMSVVFTVDGSRGPRREMKPGALMLARKNRVPLYLLRLSHSGFRLPTWDRFLIPWPFARVTIAQDLIDFSDPGEKRSVKQLLPLADARLRELGDQ